MVAPGLPTIPIAGALRAESYRLQNGSLKGVEIADGADIPAESLWLDLFNPTPEERRAVNRALAMELPTRADMEEIEISSRLYQEDGGLFMTALVLSNADSDIPPPMW